MNPCAVLLALCIGTGGFFIGGVFYSQSTTSQPEKQTKQTIEQDTEIPVAATPEGKNPEESQPGEQCAAVRSHYEKVLETLYAKDDEWKKRAIKDEDDLITDSLNEQGLLCQVIVESAVQKEPGRKVVMCNSDERR